MPRFSPSIAARLQSARGEFVCKRVRLADSANKMALAFYRPALAAIKTVVLVEQENCHLTPISRVDAFT